MAKTAGAKAAAVATAATKRADAAVKRVADATAKAAADAAAAVPPLPVGAPTPEEEATAKIEREIQAHRAATALLAPASSAAPGAPGAVGTSASPKPSRRPSPARSPTGEEEHPRPSRRGSPKEKTKDAKDQKKRRRHSDRGDRPERHRRRRGNDEARHMFETVFFTTKNGVCHLRKFSPTSPPSPVSGGTYLPRCPHPPMHRHILSLPPRYRPLLFLFRKNKTGVIIDASSAPPRPPRQRMGEHRYLCAPIHRCTATSSLSRPSNSPIPACEIYIHEREPCVTKRPLLTAAVTPVLHTPTSRPPAAEIEAQASHRGRTTEHHHLHAVERR